MDQVTFAVPDSSSMGKQDHIDLLINQATAIIVSNYLAHLDVVISKLDPKRHILDAAPYVDKMCVTVPDLKELITSVRQSLQRP